MIDFEPKPQGSGSHSGAIQVKVLGLGGAGSNILDRLVTGGGDPEKLVMLNTNAKVLSNSFAGTKIQLGKQRTMGLGCGGDPDLGRESAVESTQEIREVVRGCGMVFLCVGLGGGTGSGAAPVVARIAREENCFVTVFVTLPFHFEGRRRLQQANLALDELKEAANALLVFDNDRMSDLIGPEEGAQEAFAEADKMVCLSIRSIMTLVERPGMIRIGMDELRSVLQGRDSRCLFGFGRATGRDRARRSVEAALENPMLKGSEVLSPQAKLLVHVSGDESVKLSEVEEVMTALRERMHDSTEVLFGVSTNEDLGEGLCVAIISSVPKDAVGKIPAPAPSTSTTPKIGFNSSLIDTADSFSNDKLDDDLEIPMPPPAVAKANPLPTFDEDLPPSSLDNTSPVPLGEGPLGKPKDEDEEDLKWAPRQWEDDEKPSTKSEPLFPEPPTQAGPFTYDSRERDETPDRDTGALPPPKDYLGSDPINLDGAEPTSISPLSPPSKSPFEAPEGQASSIFTVVDDETAQQPTTSSSPVPGIQSQPGVKIEFEGGRPRPGQNSAPTITLEQPKSSLASKSVDDSATRPHGPSTGIELGRPSGGPAPKLEADDVAPPPMLSKPQPAAAPGPGKDMLPPPRPPKVEFPSPREPALESQEEDSIDPPTGGVQEGNDLGKKILDFEVGAASVSKTSGRFEKTEPTVVDGQDLDVPTYLRKTKRG